MASLAEFMQLWRDDNPYITARTSGSTGAPKPIHLLKSDMRASARATNEFFGIGSNSTLVIPLSFDYIAAKMMAVRADTAGCRLIELPAARTIDLSAIDRTADLMSVVPANLDGIISSCDAGRKIRNLLIGGAAPDYDKCEQIASLGINAFISYGMTETCSHVAIARAEDPLRIYKAMPGITFETDDEGRLTVVAPNFSFGRLKTNDIVELKDSRSFVWRGRCDNVINSGGIKLYPEELETLYSCFIPEVDFYVCRRPHEIWGECVCIVFEGSDDDASKILSRLYDNIADHRQIPRRIEAVAALPRTYNGKIIRR